MKKIILFLFIISTLSYTQTINGIVVEEKVIVNNEELLLNGWGIRNKFFIDIYVGALYIPVPTNDAVSIINSPTPKSMYLHIIPNWISPSFLKSALKSELKNSSTKEEMDHLEKEIDIFLSTFDEKIKKEDKFIFNIIPDIGVEVYKNDKFIKSIEGEEFSKRLLELWIGDKPVDKKLKMKVLGSQEADD